MSAHTESKAVRLLAEGAVEPMPFPVAQYTVRGDSGSYVVFVSATAQLCSCPATGRCSHIEAAVSWHNATDGEKGLMQAALERRKMLDADKADELFARLGA